jgi:hypothetical protein
LLPLQRQLLRLSWQSSSMRTQPQQLLLLAQMRTRRS